jgi:hypothetical protein
VLKFFLGRFSSLASKKHEVSFVGVDWKAFSEPWNDIETQIFLNLSSKGKEKRIKAVEKDFEILSKSFYIKPLGLWLFVFSLY